MTIPTAVLLKLATLGLSEAQAEAVASMLSAVELATKSDTKSESEAGIEAGREKARARWHKWKASHPETNVGKRLQPLANDSKQLVSEPTHVEVNLPNKKTNKEENKKTPRDELALVLDAEHADAVLEHRAKLRKPLSPHAAHLLALSLAECPDPNAAADVMIESGWLKVKAGWLNGTGSKHHSQAPPSGNRTMDNALDDIKSGKLDVFGLLNGNSHDTIETSYERTDRGSSGHPVQVHAFPSGRRA